MPFPSASFFLSLLPVMAKIKELYYQNINGLIFTLIFHILVFIVLNVSQFGVKQTFREAEILIDFPEELPQPEQQAQELTDNEEPAIQQTHRTNIASNRLAEQKNSQADRELQEEMERAKLLTKEVTNQLKKEIPTVDDLKMPVESTEGLDPDSLMRKLYTGDSNIEYYLENRYHVRLPKPIYLSYKGGRVEVLIVVDREGTVIEANPVVTGQATDQMLSYAKTAALRTRFNRSNQAPAKQHGRIIYHFIAQ
jgi:hypothetical protein